MARIEKYGLDSEITGSDKLLGTDGTPGSVGITKNFTIQALKAYINSGAPGTGTVTSVGMSIDSNGSDVTVAGSPIVDSGSITLSIPNASASSRGVLTAADWSLFNSKRDNDIIKLTRRVTSAELLALSGGGELEIIAAPGAGKIIVVERFIQYLDFNTTAYNFPYSNSTPPQLIANGTYYWIMTNGTEPEYYLGTMGDFSYHTTKIAINSNVKLSTYASSIATQGDSDIVLYLEYRIIDLT